MGGEWSANVLGICVYFESLKFNCMHSMALGFRNASQFRGAIPAAEVDGIVPLLCTDPEAEDVSTAVQPHPSLSLHY